MSDIQNDKLAVIKPRNKLENVEASLRDQIPEKLLVKLEDLNIGQTVDTLWHRGNADRTNWLERQKAFLADWDEFLVASAEGPFEQSSNLHLPTSFIIAKTYHARMLQALLANEATAKPRRADQVERAKAVSGLLQYTISDWANENTGLEDMLDLWVWDWVTTGVGLTKWKWDRKYTRFQDVEMVVQAAPSRFETAQDGTQREVTRGQKVEVEKDRVIETFNGPCAERLAAEDLLLIGGEGDPDRADAVIHRQYLTKSDLYMLADQKIFQTDAVDKIIMSGQDYVVGSDVGSEIKDQRAQNAGKNEANTEADLDRYQILEAYLRIDVDESGIDSEIIVWVHARTQAVLRATYLHRVNKAGKRPFTKIDFHKRPGQDYGMGLVEVLFPLSKEMDMMHNSRIDFGMLSTMPFAFYRASSSLDPETINFEPGQLIPVDDPQRDVFFPNLGNRTSFGFQEEAALQTMVERLTGISDLNLGVLSGSQGATRTATGARALVGEANANLDVHLRRLFRGWKKSLEYLLSMLQQRVDPGLGFRVTGDLGHDYWLYIQDRDDIGGDFDFDLDPSSAASNPSVRQERAGQVLQLAANPLFLQMGIVSAGNLYEAVKNQLVAVGIKDFSKYITKPAGFNAQLSPEEISNRALRGENVPILPTDDNEGFLEFFKQLMASDELLGQFDESEIAVLAGQARDRQALLAALQKQAAQAANIQQQQINSLQATQPAAVGSGTSGPEQG